MLWIASIRPFPDRVNQAIPGSGSSDLPSHLLADRKAVRRKRSEGGPPHPFGELPDMRPGRPVDSGIGNVLFPLSEDGVEGRKTLEGSFF